MEAAGYIAERFY